MGDVAMPMLIPVVRYLHFCFVGYRHKMHFHGAVLLLSSLAGSLLVIDWGLSLLAKVLNA